MDQDIVIYYFSATRNTFRAMSEMAAVFRETGAEVTIIPIDENRYYGWTADLFGFAFPINYNTLFPFIWKFLEGLPDGAGSKTFVLDTHSGSPAILKPLRLLLEKKGYVPVGSCEIEMPVNISTEPIDEEERHEKIRKGLLKAKEFAADILENRASYKTEHLGSDLKASVQRYTGIPLKAKKIFSTLRVCEELCSFCGICADVCPVKNINRGFISYIIGENCELCFRCLAHCPENAVKLNGKRIFSAKVSD